MFRVFDCCLGTTHMFERDQRAGFIDLKRELVSLIGIGLFPLLNSNVQCLREQADILQLGLTVELRTLIQHRRNNPKKFRLPPVDKVIVLSYEWSRPWINQ